MWSMLVPCLQDRLYYFYQKWEGVGVTSEYVEAKVASHLRLEFGY
jgi:hypothetical protein